MSNAQYKIHDGESYTIDAVSAKGLTVAVFGDMATTTAKPKEKHLRHARPGFILPSLHQGLLAKQFDAVMYLGDIGYEFSDENAQQFMRDVERISSTVPFHAIVGNHEYLKFRQGTLTQFQRHFHQTKTYWSINIGPVRWISINTELYGEDDVQFVDANAPEAIGNQFHVYFDGTSFVPDDTPDRRYKMRHRENQKEWLQQELESVDRIKTPFIIVQGHRPPFDTDPAFYEDIGVLMHEFQVDLFLAGHIHAHEYYEAVEIKLDNGRVIQTPPIFISGASGNKKKLKVSSSTPQAFLDKRQATLLEYGYGLIHVSSASLSCEFGTMESNEWKVLNKIGGFTF